MTAKFFEKNLFAPKLAVSKFFCYSGISIKRTDYKAVTIRRTVSPERTALLCGQTILEKYP